MYVSCARAARSPADDPSRAKLRLHRSFSSSKRRETALGPGPRDLGLKAVRGESRTALRLRYASVLVPLGRFSLSLVVCAIGRDTQR